MRIIVEPTLHLKSPIETVEHPHHIVYKADVEENHQTVKDKMDLFIANLQGCYYNRWMYDMIDPDTINENISLYYPNSQYTHSISIIHSLPYCKVEISIYNAEQDTILSMQLKNLIGM